MAKKSKETPLEELAEQAKTAIDDGVKAVKKAKQDQAKPLNEAVEETAEETDNEGQSEEEEKPKKGAKKDVEDEIAKKYGKGRLMTASKARSLVKTFVRTGIFSIDYVTGGGYARSWCSRCLGWESTGKSMMAYLVIAAFQRSCKNCGLRLKVDYSFQKGCQCGPKAKPMKAALFDIENAYTLERGESFGVDNDNLAVIQPESSEEGLDISRILLASGKYDIFVLDSVAAFAPSAEVEASIEKAQVATQARLMNKACRVWQGAINRSGLNDEKKPHVILINQYRYKAGLVFGDPKTIPGGIGQNYWSSLDVEFQKVKYHWLDENGKEIPKKKAEGEGPTYAELSFETLKNRACAPHRSGGFRFYFKNCVLPNGEEHFAGEIDELELVFKLGLIHGLIRGGGKKWRFEGLKASSQDELHAAIGANKEKYESLKERLLTVLLAGGEAPEEEPCKTETSSQSG